MTLRLGLNAVAAAFKKLAIPGAVVNPTAVASTTTAGQATVSWSPPTSNGNSPITSYVITASGFTAMSVSGSTLSLVINGLGSNISYTFYVRAVNAVGNGPDTAANAITTTGVPGAPTGVAATAGAQQATVTWAAAPANGAAVTSYVITRTPGAVTTTVGNVLTGTVTALTTGTAYTFTVHAVNSVGAGPESTASAAVTPT